MLAHGANEFFFYDLSEKVERENWHSWRFGVFFFFFGTALRLFFFSFERYLPLGTLLFFPPSEHNFTQSSYIFLYFSVFLSNARLGSFYIQFLYGPRNPALPQKGEQKEKNFFNFSSSYTFSVLCQ